MVERQIECYQPVYVAGFYDDFHEVKGPQFATLEEAVQWFDPSTNKPLKAALKQQEAPGDFQILFWRLVQPEAGKPQKPHPAKIWNLDPVLENSLKAGNPFELTQWLDNLRTSRRTRNV